MIRFFDHNSPDDADQPTQLPYKKSKDKKTKFKKSNSLTNLTSQNNINTTPIDIHSDAEIHTTNLQTKYDKNLHNFQTAQNQLILMSPQRLSELIPQFKLNDSTTANNRIITQPNPPPYNPTLREITNY